MMKEWTPSDEELVETLCRVRETDWEWSDYRAYVDKYPTLVTVDRNDIYRFGDPNGEYGEHLRKKKNYSVIPSGFMRSPQVWRSMNLSDVLDDIFYQKGADADTHRKALLLAVDDYRLAAKAKLIDLLESVKKSHQCLFREFECLTCREDGLLVYKDINKRIQAIRDANELGTEHMPSKPIDDLYIEFLGDENRDEFDVTTDVHLIKKIISCQRLKILISERIAARAEIDRVEIERMEADLRPREKEEKNEHAERKDTIVQIVLECTSKEKTTWPEIVMHELDSIQKKPGYSAIKTVEKFIEVYPEAETKRDALTCKYRRHLTERKQLEENTLPGRTVTFASGKR